MDDLGVRIKDFALDPAQDLIILLEHRPPAGPISTSSSSMSSSLDAEAAGADIRMHLRRLSTGALAAHPAASHPVFCQRAVSAVHGCMIQIVEDVVGMYFWIPFRGVLIWNWMTGEELVVRLSLFFCLFILMVFTLMPYIYIVHSRDPGAGSDLGLFVPFAAGVHGHDAQRRR